MFRCWASSQGQAVHCAHRQQPGKLRAAKWLRKHSRYQFLWSKKKRALGRCYSVWKSIFDCSYLSDFKHQEREWEQQRNGLGENPNDRLHMAGGKISGVLFMLPTWDSSCRHCQGTWVFRFLVNEALLVLIHEIKPLNHYVLFLKLLIFWDC